MRSGNQTKISELNTLIDEVEKLQSTYNALVKPIIETKTELRRHQLFFSKCTSPEEKNKEEVILKNLQKKLDELNSPEKQQPCEKLRARIEEAKTRLESLWIDIEGRCDRSSPHFLEKMTAKQ